MKDIIIKGENIQKVAQRLVCLGCTDGGTYIDCARCVAVDEAVKILIEESLKEIEFDKLKDPKEDLPDKLKEVYDYLSELGKSFNVKLGHNGPHFFNKNKILLFRVDVLSKTFYYSVVIDMVLKDTYKLNDTDIKEIISYWVKEENIWSDIKSVCSNDKENSMKS